MISVAYMIAVEGGTDEKDGDCDSVTDEVKDTVGDVLKIALDTTLEVVNRELDTDALTEGELEMHEDVPPSPQIYVGAERGVLARNNPAERPVDAANAL